MNNAAKNGLRRITLGGPSFQPRFAYGDQAEIAEVTGTQDGTLLGTGFARFAKASIPWTVLYDEVLLVIEGNVTVHTAAGHIEAGPHDCIWLPKGMELRYESERALVFYAIHPSNWASSDRLDAQS